MKSYKLKLRTGHGRAANLGRNLLLVLGMGIAGVAWGKPAIQSITVSPSSLVTGLPFSISVAASSNVTFAEATIAFHPSGTDELHVPLTRQGLVWTGSGVIPSSIRL